MEPKDSEKVIEQDLSQEGNLSVMLPISLLFREKCESPSADVWLEKLEEKFGRVDVVPDAPLSTFVLTECYAKREDGTKLSAQVVTSKNSNEIKEPLGDAIVRSQFWDCPKGVELLDSCLWQVMVSDYMAAWLPILDRAYLLSDLLEIALELFPTCTAVFSHHSGKLLTAEDVRENPYSGSLRYFRFGVNARLFNVQSKDEMIVDTLGLHALGLPDMQYHFRDFDPNDVVRHAYNTAIYQFENDAPIKSGHTIDGIEPGSRWKCQHEHSLIQPVRDVLDVATGDFAAGNR